MTVEHDDRDVEFHDLIDEARNFIEAEELGHASCEAIARTLFHHLMSRHPNRKACVKVFEDNEAGATVGNLHA